MPDKRKMTCPRCNVAMVEETDAVDLSWAGDGPIPDYEFAGILVEIHRCPSCRSQAIRPASLELSGSRRAVGV